MLLVLKPESAHNTSNIASKNDKSCSTSHVYSLKCIEQAVQISSVKELLRNNDPSFLQWPVITKGTEDFGILAP